MLFFTFSLCCCFVTKQHFPPWQWTASTANHSNVQDSCYSSGLITPFAILPCYLILPLLLTYILIFTVQQLCWPREDSYGVIGPILYSIWSLSHSWIFGNIRAAGHQAATRVLPVLMAAFPELKIPILHLNYFLSKRSPTPLINVAPLYTPWLDQTVRWVGKVGCFLSACPSSLKVWVLQTASIRQHHKLRTGLVKKHCPLPYHETQNQLKVTHAKLVLDAVGKVLTIQSKFPIHRVFKTRCNIRKPSKNKQILCKDSLSGYTKICLLKVTGNF